MAYKKLKKKLKVVCLGGGIGTSNLVRGLKNYDLDITVITSMADDGGSSGRLRRAYNIMPPGDMVSCIAALIDDQNKEMASLLTYRFPGIGKENRVLNNHKLGNLIMLAEILRTNDIYKALSAVKKMFGVSANILPATDERTHLSGLTKDNKRIHGETALQVARYGEELGLQKIYITPKDPKVNFKVLKKLKEADVIISGPGDLYTNQLPVLIIPKIKNILLSKKCKKIFILNIANKPYETKGYGLEAFVDAVEKHLGKFPFQTIIGNSNYKLEIPKKHKNYTYIKVEDKNKGSYKIVLKNLVKKDFPIYHDSKRLAKVVAENI